mgnify:CR=1 FL=1
MTPIEIVLILIGIGIIVISMFLVDKSKNSKTEFNKDGNDPIKLTEEDLEELKKKVDLAINNVAEDIYHATEDKLSHLSNEKIIAVTEYSDQVLEKINQNHEEVIFLYNMLNEKESELKELIKQLENIKKTVDYDKESYVKSTSKPAGKEEGRENGNLVTSTTKLEETNVQVELNQFMEDKPENNNHRILELYKQGHSVIEISKLLEIGQGEVSNRPI